MKKNWITICLINLSLVALLGLVLRTKILFPLPFLDFRHTVSSHSHFAFGGWVTLALMVLFIRNFLPPALQQKRVYQIMLVGTVVSSYAMLLLFPFIGYAFPTIIFSTLFILFTYAFSWVFIMDLRKTDCPKPVRLMVTGALAFLVISSIGPFWLAYMMATKTGTASSFRDAVYTFLHFQYNGFFTLSVFALLFYRKFRTLSDTTIEHIRRFAVALCISIPPSLFLSLLWHGEKIFLRSFAYIGCAMILVTLFYFFRILRSADRVFYVKHPLIRTVLGLSIASFVIKMLLQTGTVVPWLGNAVFGFRPIIIGYLHLVFLGFVTFYILSVFLEDQLLAIRLRITRFAITWFVVAVVLNEVLLMADGGGRLFGISNPIYELLLWIVAIGLFVGGILLLVAGKKSMGVLSMEK